MKVNAKLKRLYGLALVCTCPMLYTACAGTTPGTQEVKGLDMVAATEESAADENSSEFAFDMDSKEESVETVNPDTEPEMIASSLLERLAISGKGGDTNQIIATVKDAGFFTLEKTTPSEYVLTLEGATKAEQATTIVAPKGSGQIRSVRPVQSGDDLQLRIFTEPDTSLAVSQNGEDIIIAPQQEFASIDLDEARAQAADDALADEAALEDFFAIDQKYTGRLISLDLQDTEIDNALRIIAEVSNLNIIASEDVNGKITLRLIDVPWDQALDVILKTNGLDKVQEGNVVRIAPIEKLRAEREALKQAQQAEEELEPLSVQYIRISYSKAEELAPTIETVLTERGTVVFDERSNQLIVKDIRKGLRNVANLVQKLDLRTPQVLVETQIVEADRSFSRELGSELGFFFLRTPETGNALPYNFPNSAQVGGTALNSQGENVSPTASSFPAAVAQSAVSALFASADGSKSLNVRLSQAEQEGRVRIVSSPSVAVANNTPAVIKSVRKIRIRLPNGGVSVATGQGASSSGGGSVATETVEAGIILNVTAQASPDYYVLLDVEAESSTLGPDTSEGIPEEIERSTTSSVLISSGQTFALGGIYRVTEQTNVFGVPFLKDVPVIGHFFRNQNVMDRDEELLFFITPRIIEGSFDDASMKAAV